MPTYRIADLTVNMSCGGRTAKQSIPYQITSDKKADITVRVTKEELEEARKNAPSLPLDEWEYILSATNFYRSILKFDGFMLHASAILYEGRAFLFSAPSGTGKSTHTSLWISHFGKDRVRILNDDKPAIRRIGDTFCAYGTPWSGKQDISIPVGVPLAGICFLEQSDTNRIVRLNSKDALANLFSQTLRRLNDQNLDRLFKLLSMLLTEIPIYKLYCTISEDAVVLAERTMNRKSLTPVFPEAAGRLPISVKPGYRLITRAGSNIVSADDDALFNGIITLNSTGVFLFRILQNGATKAELALALAQEYSIDLGVADQDVTQFLDKLRALDLLQGY